MNAGITVTLGTVPATEVISGVVLDAEDKPVARAQVVMQAATKNGAWSSSKQSDSRGRFRFETKMPNAVDLIARNSKERANAGIVQRVYPGSDDVVIRLTAPSWVAIRARDLSGNPVEITSLSTTTKRSGEQGGRLTGSVTQKLVENELLFARPLSRQVLVVGAEGFETVELGPFEPEELGDSIEVVFRPQPVLSGLVVANGKPVQGATVELVSPLEEGEEYVTDRHPLLHLGTEHECATHTDGSFRMPLDLAELTRERYIIQVIAEGFAISRSAPLHLDSARMPSDLTIALDHGGAITGTVRALPGRTPTGTIVEVMDGGRRFRTQRVAADGTYRFDNLRPGSWMVGLTEDESESRSMMGGSGPWTVTEPIEWTCEVFAGETTVHDFDLSRRQGAALEGSLFIDGRAAQGWSAELNLNQQSSLLLQSRVPEGVTTDLAGMFELRNAPVRSYVLKLTSRTSEPRVIIKATVELREGPTPWSLSYNTARITGRSPGSELIHTATIDGAEVRTTIPVSSEGEFDALVPVGSGKLTSKESDSKTELDVPVQGLEGFLFH